MNLAFSEASLSSIPINAFTSQPAEIVADLLRAAHRIRGALSTHFAEFGLSDARPLPQPDGVSASESA